VFTCDQAGYAAIGAGATFAQPAFEAEGYTGFFDWSASLMITHAARRDSEMAAGVGHEADMWIISEVAGVQWLGPTHAVVKVLDGIYARRRKRERAAVHRDHAQLANALEALNASRKAEAEGQTGPSSAPHEAGDGGGSAKGKPKG
jgi:hypothetical protein